MTAEIMKDRGPLNPLIRVPADDVAAWLRTIADKLGFQDRPICAVQINVKHDFVGGKNYHGECPELIVMVSNIPGNAE